jgi:hypothetical protein
MRFGTIDCDDAHCSNEQIERFEQNSDSMTDRVKQQFLYRKIIIRTVKNILSFMDCNKGEIKEGLLQVK